MSQRLLLRKPPALLAVFALMFVVLSSQPASATGGWPQDLTNLPDTTLVTHPDGSATVGSCSTGSTTYDAVTFDVDGVVTAEIEPESGEDSLDFCDAYSAQIGADGTIYATTYESLGSGYQNTQVYLAANDGEDREWTTALLADCTSHENKRGYVTQMVLGLTVTSTSPSCRTSTTTGAHPATC